MKAARLACCAAWLAALLVLPASAAPFTIDSAHSSAHFSASHFGRSEVRGRILQVEGRIDFDLQGRSGKVEVSLPVAAIDTGIMALDNVLRSPQFFDADQFPVIRFEADDFRFDGERLAAVAGRLSLHGITRPVELQAQRFACGEVKLGLLKRQVCGGHFTAAILRSEFGMRRFLPDVGDQVTLDISIEASPAN